MTKFCSNCGNNCEDTMANCPNCGAALVQAAPQQQQVNPGYAPQGTPAAAPKQKIVAGLLGIFLGGWGAHNFYLGNTQKAIIQIVVSLVTCGIGSLWGFIEGIMILTGSINTDSNGNPLV